MFIDGFSLSRYRSFGAEAQKIGPLGKVNLLVGQNNSGKSNVLLFLKNDLLPLIKSIERNDGGFKVGGGSKAFKVDTLNQHIGLTHKELSFSLGIALGSENYKRTVERVNKLLVDTITKAGAGGITYYNESRRKSTIDMIENVLHADFLTQGTNIAWFTYVENGPSEGRFSLSDELVDEFIKKFTPHHSDSIRFICGSARITEEKILSLLSPDRLRFPEVHLIPAIRQVGESGSEYKDFSGLGIIRRLHELQNPPYDKQHLKKQFQQINEFLRNITGNTTAELEIPREEDMIIVHMDGRTLPLGSLGTGIHEMIILAAAATLIENQIVCIEEPEIHLHPLLQRKLVRYLQNETNNQYFLTTHSAHLLDTPGVQIFHVRHQDGSSNVTAVSSSVERALVCADLGYRASDLVQANSIIWVEGPSDRIYLRHWIKAVDPSLVEGLHYSIMFYGGRLLSHLSANDPEIEDFISLRRLNRYISILIDSDKAKATGTINATKKRIQKEFNEGPGFAWVTQGREIENYVDHSSILAAVQTVHTGVIKLNATGQFDHCLPFKNKKGELKSDVDKIKVAHKVIEQPANLDVLDLRKKVEKLVDFIKEANDL